MVYKFMTHKTMKRIKWKLTALVWQRMFAKTTHQVQHEYCTDYSELDIGLYTRQTAEKPLFLLHAVISSGLRLV